MITPDNQIPLDDSEENDDQKSQQDVHGNGFDDTPEANEVVDDNSDPASLQQAYDASEPSFTLNLGDDGDTDTDDDE
jgi:hypothetical protein